MSAHVVERLSAYLDGELAVAERQAVDAHLRLCDDCARHLEDLAAVDELARALPLEAPPGYFESLPARVRFRVTPGPRRRLQVPTWSWAVAAALLLAVIVPLTLERRPLPPGAAPNEIPAPPPPAAAVVPAPSQAAAPAPAPAAEAAKRETFGEGRASGGKERGNEADRKLLASRDDVRAREKGAFAAPPASPAPPPTASPAQAEALRSPTPPPGATLAKAEDKPARPQAATAPKAAGRAAVAQAEPFAAAPDAGSLEGPAGQHLSVVEEEKDVADVAPPADEAKKQDWARPSAPTALSDSLAPRRERRAAPVLRFRSLLAEAPTNAEDARRIRERWRSFLEQSPPATQADEARVRVVEMGVKAWRLSNDPADLSLLIGDAEAYLRREDAAQGDRVRSLLRTTGH